MSFFSNALVKLTEGRSLARISEASGISQQMLSSYRSGTRGIKPRSLERLIRAFPDEEAAALVIAHLKDECPKSLFPRLSFEVMTTSPHVEESPAEYKADKDLEAASDFLSDAARRDRDLRALLIDLYRVLR